MAALVAGGPALPSGVDDRTDTSPQYNTNSSRATYLTSYVFVPDVHFAIGPPGYYVTDGEGAGGDADIPSEQAGVWAWLGD